MHVRWRDTFVPANDLFTQLAKCCEPLFVDNFTDGYDLSVCGSSVLIQFRGRLFQLCCAHQLKNCDREAQAVRLVETSTDPEFPSRCLPPEAAYSVQAHPVARQNLSDAVVLKYSADTACKSAWRFVRLDEDQFLRVPPTGSKQVVAYLAFGFPSQAVAIDLTKDEGSIAHFRSRWVRMVFEPAAPNAWDIDNRIPMTSLDSFQDMGIEPDGISGSPVFAIYLHHSNEMRFGLCGVISDANRQGRVAVYSAVEILRYLSKIE